MKKTVCFIIGILLIMFASLTVYSEEYENKFMIKKIVKNCIFQIYWENKSVSANVKLTAPNGTVFDKNYGNYHSSEGLVWITVDTASKGEWKVSVEGNGLGKIDLVAGTMPDYIKINKFNTTQVNSNEFDISWNIANSSGEIKFSIYADKHNSGNGGTMVAQFNGSASGSKKIKIDNIDSGEYFIYLKAVDLMQVPDIKYSNNFFKIAAINSAPKIGKIEYGLLNDKVYAKWQVSSENDKYKFMLFNKGEAAPFYENSTTDNWYAYPLSSDIKNIELAVAIIKNGKLGDYERFNVNTDVNLDYKVKLPQNDNINYNTLRLSADFNKPLLMSVYANQKTLIEKTDKPGDYKIDLLDGENNVCISFMDDSGNIKTEERTFYVDTYPPQLQIVADFDGKHVTKPSIIISGKAEPAAILNINGRNAVVDGIGNYSHKVNLLPGNNTITISAADAAGNESKLVLTVTFDVFNSLIFYIALGSIIVVMLSAYYIIIFIRIKRQNKPLYCKAIPEIDSKLKKEDNKNEKDN